MSQVFHVKLKETLRLADQVVHELHPPPNVIKKAFPKTRTLLHQLRPSSGRIPIALLNLIERNIK